MSITSKVLSEKQRRSPLPPITLDEVIRDLFGISSAPSEPKNPKKKSKSKGGSAKRESRATFRQ